ncbi:hypothetical protein VE01_07279 [Pseudogymnoascus verrucosus]|uniref:Uncharacterized protein n=1 Tax=Pseudogymnoascus verrucosus TaxID=342668 RepID=A0A1B8GFD8_9PEZI|nr:uncharacterized protein VE01_07279 [Pseudogymnoascus verrucosus]OBT94541.1 hypothetical protein VE01_07279 [Pseudogymnoascus verrucosus]
MGDNTTSLEGYKITEMTGSKWDNDDATSSHIMNNTESPFLFVDSFVPKNDTATKWLLSWHIDFVGNCSVGTRSRENWSSDPSQQIQFNTAPGGKLSDILTDDTTCSSYSALFEVQDTTTDLSNDVCLVLCPEDKFPTANPCAFKVDKAVAASVASAMMQSAGCTKTLGQTPTAVWPNITGPCVKSAAAGRVGRGATLCENPDIRVNSTKVARGLAKLSDDIAVKYGRSITDEEVANQNFAYEYSLTSEIKVPKIHRFFRIGYKAYIVMDFIEGVTLDEINCREHPGLIDRLALAIHGLFSQIPCGPPGPTNGGIPRGYLFSEDGALTTFNTIPKLNKWMNKRLRAKDGEPGFDFTASECVFYHQDLARRNIILRPDGSFCLIDWEHAGFYPRICAAYCLQFVRIFDWEFANDLLEALEKLWPKTENRDELLKMLNRVYQNNLRYSYFPSDHPARFENFCKNNGIAIPSTGKATEIYPYPPPDFPSPPSSPLE